MNIRPLILLTLLACTGPSTDVDAPQTDTVVVDEAPWRVVSADDALPAEVQVLDVRSLGDYTASHVDGALHLDGGAIRGTVDGVPTQALERADAEALFEAAGLRADAPILVMSRDNDTTASRVLWTLALHGASSDLLLLDGGLDAWVAAGASIGPGDPDASASAWEGVETREDLRVDKAWVLDHLDDPDVRLFDVRAASEYAGGHIPGAVHVDWTSNLDGEGLFLDADDVLANHGDPTAPTVVVYCQSGARASVSWALLRLAGLEDVRLYDGSWLEWSADDTTPRTEGDQP